MKKPIISNKGEWATFDYYDDHYTVTQPMGERKTASCGKWWADDFDTNKRTTKFKLN